MDNDPVQIWYTVAMVLEPQNRFTRREGIERGSVRTAFFVFLGITAFIGWSYIFLVSDAFMVTDIEIRGTKALDPVDVKREVYDLIDTREKPFWQPARHALLIDPRRLESRAAERLFAEHITLEREGWNILRLLIQERSRKLILRTARQSLWIDLQGTVLEELSLAEEKNMNDRRMGKKSSEPSDPPIISLPSLVNVYKPGEGIQDPRISTWLVITREAQKQGIRYREVEPQGNVSSTRVTLKTAHGYNVWLDTSDTLETQIEAFKAFEKQKPKDVVIQEYVDVRIPNRVYVK